MNYDELQNKVTQQDKRIEELEESEADLLKRVNTSIRNFVGTFRVRSGDIKSGNYVENGQGWRLTPEMAYLPNATIDGYIQVSKAADDINTGTTIIEGSKITVDGDSNFEDGYDPSTKLDSDGVGDMAFEDAVEWAKLGTTIVDGAYIKTGLINASRINTGYLSADRISTKSITGAKLADGTITPVKISYLDAEDITTGTLTGRVVRTSSGTTRVEMNTSNELVLYQNGNERTILGNGMLWFGTTSGVSSAALYGYGTDTLAISTGSYGYLFNETQFYPMSSSATCGTSSKRWSNVYSKDGSFSGDVNISGDVEIGGTLEIGGHLTPDSASSYDLGRPGSEFSYLNVNYCNRNFLPSETSLTIGNATYYWNEVNYKYLTKRGGLGVFDKGIELQDGRVVSDLESLENLKAHPTQKSQYGVPRVDVKTLPKIVFREAPIAKEDVYHEKDKKKIVFKKGDKMGDDGEEFGALVSIMIGAIKELNNKVETLKDEITNLKNK